MKKRNSHFYEFGPFRLDAVRRLLLRDGQLVPLKPKAVDTLVILIENRGQSIEKDELMERIWPDTVVEEANLTQNIYLLRKALEENLHEQNYIETIPKRGYRFVAEVRELWSESAVFISQLSLDGRQETREPVRGALPLDSLFYLKRPADDEFRIAIARRESLVLIKGASQVGKTSLLARGLQQAREAGARIILTYFQTLDAECLASAETLLLALAESIADQLDLDVSPSEIWKPHLNSSSNFERYLRREVFARVSSHIVWGMDEVDRLFSYGFANEVFGLFRSWHNMRALDPHGPWQQLTLALTYATEAHLFITDHNQSPFNVGTRLLLEDFPTEQVSELNRRYGSPLGSDTDVCRYFKLVGGHPYLVHRGLHEMITHGLTLNELEAQADRDEGLYGDHLRRILASLLRDPALCEIVRGVLRGQPCPTAESFYRLLSAGVMTGTSTQDVKPRCQLYAAYLRKRLL